eukprot:3813581-Lingulodinium_polyedra.AAC.1
MLPARPFGHRNLGLLRTGAAPTAPGAPRPGWVRTRNNSTLPAGRNAARGRRQRREPLTTL